MQRQLDIGYNAALGIIGDRDFTIVLGDNFFDDDQSQSGASGLGGEIGSKEILSGRRRKAGAIIYNGKVNIAVGEGSADIDITDGRNGLEAIFNNVEYGALNLIAVGEDS